MNKFKYEKPTYKDLKIIADKGDKKKVYNKINYCDYNIWDKYISDDICNRDED